MRCTPDGLKSCTPGRRGGLHTHVTWLSPQVVADCLIEDCSGKEWDAIALPGGMPGAEHLRDSAALKELLLPYNPSHNPSPSANPNPNPNPNPNLDTNPNPSPNPNPTPNPDPNPNPYPNPNPNPNPNPSPNPITPPLTLTLTLTSCVRPRVPHPTPNPNPNPTPNPNPNPNKARQELLFGPHAARRNLAGVHVLPC